MLDIFKTYIYRMRKSKLTYIILGISFLMCAGVFLTESLLPIILGAAFPGDAFAEAAPRNGFEMLRSMFFTGFHTVILAVFPIMFFAVDYSTGYIKNLVGYRTDKTKLAGANLILIVVYMLAGYVVNLVFGELIILIFCKNVIWQGGGKFLLYLLVIFIESVCYAQIMLFVADFLKKNIAAMIIDLVYGFLSSAIYLIVNLLVSNHRLEDSFVTESTDFGGLQVNLAADALPIEEFRLEKYTILGGASVLDIESAYGDFLRSGIIALAALAVFFFLDILALKHRDVA